MTEADIRWVTRAGKKFKFDNKSEIKQAVDKVKHHGHLAI